MNSEMISRVRDTLNKFSMLHGGERVVAAVSGGPDSTAMLHALFLLRDEYGIELAVAHLNHNLRGAESKRDLEFVREKSGEYGLEFFTRTLRAGLLKKTSDEGLQAAARERRLAFLSDTAKKFKASRIAVGHTMDDQAETILMRVMTGSGLAGLSGMWPVRGLLIKPLIETNRAEVMDFIKGYGLSYIVDSSNLKDSYLRNNIRHRLLPFIKENYNPSIVSTLARTAELLRHDNNYIDAIARHLGVVIKKTQREVVLDAGRLRGLHHALLTRVFLSSAGSFSRRSRIGSSHIMAFIELVNSNKPNLRMTLPGGLTVRREYGRIILTPRSLPEAKPFDTALLVPGVTKIRGIGSFETTLIEGRLVSRGKGTACFDYDAIGKKLKARSFHPGDRIRPFGMKGHRKVKDIFIDEKIPLGRRGRTPLVFADDEVLWVAGIRQSEACRVNQDTAKTLKIKFRRSHS